MIKDTTLRSKREIGVDMELNPEQQRRFAKATTDAHVSQEERRQRFIEEHDGPLVDEAIAEVQAALDIRTSPGDWEFKTYTPRNLSQVSDLMATANISGVTIYKRYGQPAYLWWAKNSGEAPASDALQFWSPT